MLAHHVLRRATFTSRHYRTTLPCRWNSNDAFQPGDPVLLRHKINRYVQPIFARTLTPGKEIKLPRGSLKHDDIIGKKAREIVFSRKNVSKGKNAGSIKPDAPFRLHNVRLDDYVRLTDRLVTPIYPADAALIVELLDLHPTALARDDDPSNRFEILEAGTGHGALTLYLARALHPGNAHLSLPPVSSVEDDSALVRWKSSRKAILHTLDIKSAYTSHARNLIHSFKKGLYAPTIDFHTSPVGPWVSTALKKRRDVPFLSHAILDLPDSDQELSAVAAAVKTDGTIVVFNPSITQIMQCLRKVREEGMQLELEKVIELPGNGGAGGREWDVRPIVPRSRLKKDAAVAEAEQGGYEPMGEAGTGSEGESLEIVDGEVDGSEVLEQDHEQRASSSAKEEMICRPKVGGRIAGGGFLGVFRKWRDLRAA